jgi:hypothetical protein
MKMGMYASRLKQLLYWAHGKTDETFVQAMK